MYARPQENAVKSSFHATTNRIRLSEIDVAHMYCDGSSSVIFFKGDPRKAAVHLRGRFTAVAEANPWLLGRIVGTGRRNELELEYPAGRISDALVDQAFWIDPPGLYIHPDMRYNNIARSVKKSKAGLQTGFELAKNADLVTRITIASDASDLAFGVVVHVSHVVADGTTSFAIMNMLATSEKISALTPIRNLEAIATITSNACKQYTWHRNLGNICFGFCYSAGCLHSKVTLRRLDKSRIANERKRQSEVVTDNDIVTSNFGRVTKAYGVATVQSHRGSIEGASPTHAGNYISGFVFGKGHFETPGLVRQFFGKEHALPTSSEILTSWCAHSSRFAVVSDLKRFCKDISIPGCEELIKFPLMPNLRSDMCFILKCDSKEPCVMYRSKYDDTFFSENAPVGDPVSRSIFC